jgi:hypothetical protein
MEDRSSPPRYGSRRRQRARLVGVGIELVDLGQPSVGPRNYAALPAYKRGYSSMSSKRRAGVDALVCVSRQYRELCAHERDWPFRSPTYSKSSESMGSSEDDSYKRLKLKQDVDAIIGVAAI